MKLFLDSADLDEVREAAGWGVLSGVTTNPSLLAKAGARDFQSVIREICTLVPGGPISAEVVSEDTAGMLREARELAALHPQVVIKIPMTPAGMAAVRALKDEGIRTNVTLVFSTAQGLLAAAAGASFVSPFVGRLDDTGADGMAVVREIVSIYRLYGYPTEVIAASIRHPRHVVEAALAGAHIATIPFKVLRQLFEHPLTRQGIERFLADWRALQAPRGVEV
ncbi:MAG TPA: fructose-6-phosphate aldolase [Firmicutes bacterium]|uniref:fructose-6-phosphate aldolase n=1 Tax=Gelria sp. Kuro-4 TaxID=2796927 RepID=UPI001988059C|nr:fructose-6-phosphate aldolase [Gelria sp. Kuro-4]BCV24062.1 putative transaldolase [Gelria sp. Kuro-4]HHV56331.1 fructose-6-phosphate aldolase [Bacillota bacterium]